MKIHCISVLPQRFVALHWHGDTFEILLGAVRMAENRAELNP